MAKAVALVSALCILAVATVAHGHREVFDVEGEVYCDPCRFQFKSEISYKLPGATVRLECRNIDTKALTSTSEAVTDQNGRYRIKVVGDHELDICQVNVVKSPNPACAEPMTDVVDSKVEITKNIGIHSDARYINPIGFMTKKPVQGCVQLHDKYFINDDN